MKVSLAPAVFLSAILMLPFSCTQNQVEKKGNVTISVTVSNPVSDGKIVLEKLNTQDVERIDSLKTSAKQFEFKLNNPEPSFYRINFYDRQYVTFIVGRDDKNIRVEADGDRATGRYTVTGSEATVQKNQADSIMSKFSQRAQALNNEALVARNNQDFQKFQQVGLEFQALEKARDEELKKLIWEFAPSVAAIYALNYIDIEKHFSFVDSVSGIFADGLPNSQYTRNLVAKVGRLKRLAVGSEAPEISLPNPDGEVITLSSLRGKYVLIDFWAAWCRPCRAENPNVKKVYAQYSGKGFEILGVSLDRRKQDWVKAIEDDGLPWKHVSDLKYFNSEAAEIYEISAIPATYLVDPEGKIVAKGLRGHTLRAKLAEIFG